MELSWSPAIEDYQLDTYVQYIWGSALSLRTSGISSWALTPCTKGLETIFGYKSKVLDFYVVFLVKPAFTPVSCIIWIQFFTPFLLCRYKHDTVSLLIMLFWPFVSLMQSYFTTVSTAVLRRLWKSQLDSYSLFPQLEKWLAGLHWDYPYNFFFTSKCIIRCCRKCL